MTSSLDFSKKLNNVKINLFHEELTERRLGKLSKKTHKEDS
jgi:hypothetical protein